MEINKRLGTLRFSYAFHRMPGMRWLGRNIPPLAYYRWASRAARLSYYAYPSDWRRTRYLRQVLAAQFDPSSVKTIAQKNIVFRQWQKILIHGWPSWAERWSEWACIDGEHHLRRALAEGKGAILLSGHAYGFVSLVAPLLSQKGYRLHRTGQGNTGDPVKRWGRDWSLEGWEYDSFGQDFWQHVRSLNRMHQAIKKNQIVHILVTGFPQGDPQLEIEFYYKRFFLDPVAMRILETLRAPVLPCVPISDDSGRLIMTIHPPLAPTRAEIMQGFGPLYARYLRERPEFAIFWRKVARQQENW
jgi:lauroyl/myristoyl acyltransferase